MRAFDVFVLDGENLPVPFRTPWVEKSIMRDTIFYADSDPITEDEVRESLINHDGYPSNITVWEDV